MPVKRARPKHFDGYEIGLMRVVLGAYLYAYYLRLLPNFYDYFAPGGMIEPSLLLTPKLSLVLWGWSSVASTIFMACLLALIGLFVVGYHAKRVLIPLYVLHLSFHHANPYIIHEPQQLTNLLLVLCFFLPIDGAGTVLGKRYERGFPTGEADVLIIRAAAVYLGIYYFLAGAKKLSDPLWRSGESLWNLLQWPPFAVEGPISFFLIGHPEITRAGSYFTLAFELGFLFLVFTRFRPLLILLGAFLHTMIFFTLEVGSFPYVLAPWYALLLDTATRSQFRAGAKSLAKAWARIRPMRR